MSNDDYDSPWKEVIESYFREFMDFFFPAASREIDWGRGYQFLDKELQQVTREAEVGRRVVDKLAQVWRDGGAEAWVLVHLEVQGQKEADFERRMYTYNYRLYDRYQRIVVSLAVLSDEQARWRPKRFGYGLWGCSVAFRFPVVKLLDYRRRWAELEASNNPFAVVVMAHLKTQATRRDDKSRYGWKLRLVRRLYERQYSKEDVLRLFRFIDWLMRLPEEMEDNLWRELHQYEEEKRMPYITSVERIGLKKGLLAAIKLGLKLKFGEAGLRLLPEITALTDIAVLEEITAGLERVKTLDELRRIYQPIGSS